MQCFTQDGITYLDGPIYVPQGAPGWKCFTSAMTLHWQVTLAALRLYAWLPVSSGGPVCELKSGITMTLVTSVQAARYPVLSPLAP